MAEANDRWWTRPQIWIELFAIANVGFLTFDIYLAHSVNQFRNRAEYIPLIFSATAPIFLIVGLAVRPRWPAVWKDLGYLVGWAAVLVGFCGVLLALRPSMTSFTLPALIALTGSMCFAASLVTTRMLRALSLIHI